MHVQQYRPRLELDLSFVPVSDADGTEEMKNMNNKIIYNHTLILPTQ